MIRSIFTYIICNTLFVSCQIGSSNNPYIIYNTDTLLLKKYELNDYFIDSTFSLYTSSPLGYVKVYKENGDVIWFKNLNSEGYVSDWTEYYKNGIAKEYISYDIINQLIYRSTYTSDGELIKEEGDRRPTVAIESDLDLLERGDTLKVRLYQPSPPHDSCKLYFATSIDPFLNAPIKMSSFSIGLIELDSETDTTLITIVGQCKGKNDELRSLRIILD